MAKAMMGTIESYEPAGASVRIRFAVCYFGTDVPGGSQPNVVETEIDVDSSLADIKTAYAAAIRSKAVALGLTVPANKVLMQELTKG